MTYTPPVANKISNDNFWRVGTWSGITIRNGITKMTISMQTLAMDAVRKNPSLLMQDADANAFKSQEAYIGRQLKMLV